MRKLLIFALLCTRLLQAAPYIPAHFIHEQDLREHMRNELFCYFFPPHTAYNPYHPDKQDVRCIADALTQQALATNNHPQAPLEDKLFVRQGKYKMFNPTQLILFAREYIPDILWQRCYDFARRHTSPAHASDLAQEIKMGCIDTLAHSYDLRPQRGELAAFIKSVREPALLDMIDEDYSTPPPAPSWGFFIF